MRRPGRIATLVGAALAAAASLAQAQQPAKVYRIGMLGPGPADCAFPPSDAAKGTQWEGLPLHPVALAMRFGLRDAGLLEGRDYHVEGRCYGNPSQPDAAPVAAELAALDADAYMVVTGADALAHAVKTKPVVFMAVPDPVAFGLVQSLRRPGGNLTGISGMVDELVAKRIELLREIVPSLRSIGLLTDRRNSPVGAAAEAVAGRLDLATKRFLVDKPEQLPEALDAAHAQGVDALMFAGALFWVHREQIANLAKERALPTACTLFDYVKAGCLVSYSWDNVQMGRRAGELLARVLKGANPAEMPVEQPTVFELGLNLSTAKALGLTIPPALLARADRVIE